MSARVTRRELAGVMVRLERAMREAGIMRENESSVLEHGSKVNGIAYQVWIGNSERVHGWRPFGSLYLGRTAAECERSLLAAACALEAANEARKHKDV